MPHSGHERVRSFLGGFLPDLVRLVPGIIWLTLFSVCETVGFEKHYHLHSPRLYGDQAHQPYWACMSAASLTFSSGS